MIVSQDIMDLRNSESIIEGGSDTSFTWKLRGENVTLNDVKVQDVSYVKRSSTELQTLRNEFNTTTRKAFLENLGQNAEYLRNAGFSETDILKMVEFLMDGKFITNCRWMIAVQIHSIIWFLFRMSHIIKL